MAQLQDKARPRDFMQVVQMFRTEFATTHPDEIFDQFSREPIAAASLAQVHTAFIKGTDEKVAVKVQYPRLQNLLKSDLYAMQFVTRLAAMTFVDADFSWIFDDFKPSLLAELNFEGEGKRSERVARNFSGKEEVYVPKVHWDFTSKRILTMEFVEGCKISDLGAIEKMGFKKSKIAEKVVSVFSEMIFCHGFVHCDPHPGNILIRKNPQNHTRFQLVLLDHGLYRELDENFRRDYCSLWKALFYRNEELLKKSAENLGAGRFYKVFPLIFTFKRFDSKNSSVVNSKISPEEREKIKNDVGKVSIGDVNKFLQSLPKDMLLIFRTNALIRSLNYNLGGTTATRLRVMFSHAIRGSLLHNTQPTPLQHDMEVPILLGKPTFFESLLIMFELWRFKITLWFIVIWDSYSKSSIFKSEQPVPITAQISKDPRNPEILG